MESEFFLNAGVPPPPLHFVPTSTIPTWPTLSSAIETQTNELNSFSEQTPNSFFNANWEKSTDQSLHFDSALSSMVSSPAASNSNISSDNFMIRELIGKLGNIGNGNNSGEISPHSQPMLAASYNINNGGNNSTNTSCYSTPLNSPPKLNRFPPKESLNFPNLGALNSSVAEFTADPGFAERAARFSCFGSRSFNGRTSQLGLNNAEFAFKCNNHPNPLMGNGKLPRVSSSPSLKAIGSQKGNKNYSSSPLFDRSELGNSSQEENCSSVSEQTPNAEAATLKVPNELNSKKRKSVSKGKLKESQPANASKDAEIDETSNSKRSKSNEGSGNEKSSVKAEEEQKDEKQNKDNNNSKPPEPPKDYIHVRARRGQATDSHSLAERVRREKISERMKLLQDLVPGCNKVTGKALMLDEIINYVQSLQRQVEFLSMKLASVNTRLDFNMDTLIPKDIFQSPIFPLDSSAPAIFGHQPQQNPPLHSNISNGTVPQCSVGDPLDTALCQNFNMHLPPLDPFNHTIPQYPTFSEDDLQTIVQMGFRQNPNSNQELPLQPQNFPGSSQASHMKIEP
ncbi:hypothetical protein JCGZ_15137 [Jatropha curcas]|uniref:BHLH domain-containing protein n=1 Tax=Jatropha curcas TaxID=180498 RepID=A0A067LA66_JATCU|nr:transcription factor bHLH62 [Jatropha curcas]KDP45272.1 hypothetical protein JCGZ_15137 [Jatropha curcas]